MLDKVSLEHSLKMKHRIVELLTEGGYLPAKNQFDLAALLATLTVIIDDQIKNLENEDIQMIALEISDLFYNVHLMAGGENG